MEIFSRDNINEKTTTIKLVYKRLDNQGSQIGFRITNPNPQTSFFTFLFCVSGNASLKYNKIKNDLTESKLTAKLT